MKFKNFKIKHFLSALLSIMEVNFRDKSFSITNYICIFSIYFQPLSYISKINYKNGADPKLSVLNQFFFLINYPNILSYVRLNGIFYIVFALVNIILYFLLIMFILNTILLRYKMNRILESKIFIYLNYVCQKITYIFNSFLLIPILEILSNSLDCDWYSYITQCNSVPMILSLLSILGFGLSIFYCFLFLWLNRSYLFLDSHVLNSKFTISIFLRYISKVSLVILWPLFKNNHIIVFVLIHSIGILGLIDFFLEFHISNKQYGKFYLSVLMSYQTIVSLYTIDKYTNLFEEVDLFFIIFICVILFIKTSLFIFEKYHINILINNFSRSNYLVYALENLYYNYLNKYNEIDSFNFYGMLRLHVINCEIKDCCLSRKKLDMIETMKYGEKENLINNFISEIFIRQLQKIISNEKKNFNYDTIIFKYCSFLSNYSLNPIKAFYEIQHIMTLKQQKSFYFNSISLILLKKVKSMIFTLEKQTNINDLANEKEIDLKTYFQILKEKKKIKENFISILKLKLTFFDKYKEGIFSYEQMIKNCNALINPIKEFRNELDKKLIERKENSRLIFLFKFQILFQSFVLNNVNEGLRIEDELEKLKKKEMTLDTTILNFNSFFYNNLVTIQISYLVNNGLIIESSKNFQFANFFNYTSEELKSIKNIDTFMPEIISHNHKSFITHYVNKPRTKIKEKKYISSFALTKEGFIFPMKLYVGHCFDQNYDFAFHAALIDLGLRNEKIILVDSIGQIVGLTKEFFKLFPNQDQKIFNNQFKYLNIYPLISNMETIVSKNQLFEDNISLTVSNINSLLSIPSNFDEILDIILLKVREDEDESKNNKRSNSKRSETMKSKKSEASSKTLKSGNNNRDRTVTSKFFSRFFKTVNCSISEKKEIEEKIIQNQLSLKEIFSELTKNAQSFNKFLINYSIKSQSHNISDKSYLKLACITINTISIYNNKSKQTKEDNEDELKMFDPEITIQQSPNLSNSKMLSQDVFSNIPESEISGLNLPPINKPIVELGNQNIASNEIVGTGTTIIHKETENNYEDNKLFTTENDQEQLFQSKEMKLEKSDSSNLKKSKIKKTKTNSFSDAENKVSKNLSSGGKINLLNENASQNTSTNQSKKTFIIFNIIKMIQHTYPNQIKAVHISQYLQASVVVAFCLVVYIISDEYIGKSHEPLQLSTSNLAKIYNFYTAACLLTIRGEFTVKNFLGNQPAAAIYQGIYNDIFNISYYGIKNIVEEEETNSKNFDYLNYMKTYQFETTDPNAPILKKQTIFSFLKEINKIAFLLIKIPVTQVNTKSLEYFQVNFMNFYDYYQILAKKISNNLY